MKRIKCFLENVQTGEQIEKYIRFGTLYTVEVPQLYKGEQFAPVKFFDVSTEFYDWVNELYKPDVQQTFRIRFTEGARVGFTLVLVQYSVSSRQRLTPCRLEFHDDFDSSADYQLYFFTKGQLDLLVQNGSVCRNIGLGNNVNSTIGSALGCSLYYDRRFNSLLPTDFNTPLVSFYPTAFPLLVGGNYEPLNKYLNSSLQSIRFSNDVRQGIVSKDEFGYGGENLVRSVSNAIMSGSNLNLNDRIERLYNNTQWKNLLQNTEVENIPTGGSPSESQGGNASYTDTTEEIKPEQPTISARSQMGNVWLIPSDDKMRQITTWLINPSVWESFSRLFTNPIDYISGAISLPVKADGLAMNYSVAGNDSGIEVEFVSQYVVTTNETEVSVTPFFDNFMDYSPYTKLQLYLPYIGYVDLDTDYFMNDVVKVKYNIEIMTGACVAFVSNSTNIIGMYNGNCGCQVPIKSTDFNNAITNTLTNSVTMLANVASGNVAGAVANTASIITSQKPSFRQSGALTTVHGRLSNRRPFLVITRPQISIPPSFSHDNGFKSNITSTIGELSGFTAVESVELKGIACTTEEKEMIQELLTNGIYV